MFVMFFMKKRMLLLISSMMVFGLCVFSEALPNSKLTNDQETLFLASFQGDLERVRDTLHYIKGKGINAQHQGFTSLHVAAQNNYKNIVELLLANGADVNVKTGKGVTALHFSAQAGYVNITQLLLATDNIDVDAKDNQGRTALHYSVRGRHEEITQLLLDADSIDVDAKDDKGRTALHVAVYKNHIGIVKLLIDHGADVNAQIYLGHTPLMVSIGSNYNTISLYLLNLEEIDLSIRNIYGQNALDLSRVEYNSIIGQKIKKRQSLKFKEDLEKGISELDLAKVKTILKTDSSNINNYLYDDVAPLHVAASHKRYFNIMIELLDIPGIDVNVETNDKVTPLHIAVMSGCIDIVISLLDNDFININAKDSTASTPLILASKYGYSNIVKLFINRKEIDLDAEDFRGRTALDHANENKRFKIVDLLINH